MIVNIHLLVYVLLADTPSNARWFVTGISNLNISLSRVPQRSGAKEVSNEIIIFDRAPI
jgi:hypothetical protein